MFFAAADRVFAELTALTQQQQQVVLLMDGVSLLDAGGLAAFEKFIVASQKQQCHILLADLQFQVLKTLAKAKIRPIDGVLSFYPTLSDALKTLPKRQHSWQLDSIGEQAVDHTLDNAGL